MEGHEQGGQKIDTKTEEQAADFANYKGIYFGDTNEKYIDEETGAHFRYRDLC